MNGPEHLIEFFHGYTYSGNPASSRREPRDARHLSARGAAHPRLRDGEALGGRAVQPEGPAARHRHPRTSAWSARSSSSRSPASRRSAPSRAFLEAYEQGIMIRTTGDTIAMSPPLIIEKSEIDELIGKLAGRPEDAALGAAPAHARREHGAHRERHQRPRRSRPPPAASRAGLQSGDRRADGRARPVERGGGRRGRRRPRRRRRRPGAARRR